MIITRRRKRRGRSRIIEPARRPPPQVLMESFKLIVRKAELIRALRVLGTNRRRRFSSVVPIWLAYESEIGELRLREERGGVTASLPAIGTWPAAGTTVNLFPLRRAAEAVVTEDVELIAIGEAVLVPTAKGHVSLPLLDFGPAGLVPPPRARPDRHSDLPLFIWAARLTH
jgi:hypothetical protein